MKINPVLSIKDFILFSNYFEIIDFGAAYTSFNLNKRWFVKIHPKCFGSLFGVTPLSNSFLFFSCLTDPPPNGSQFRRRVSCVALRGFPTVHVQREIFFSVMSRSRRTSFAVNKSKGLSQHSHFEWKVLKNIWKKTKNVKKGNQNEKQKKKNIKIMLKKFL